VEGYFIPFMLHSHQGGVYEFVTKNYFYPLRINVLFLPSIAYKSKLAINLISSIIIEQFKYFCINMNLSYKEKKIKKSIGFLVAHFEIEIK